MKITQSQILDLLKAIGADVELVDNQDESDFDKDAVISAIDENRKKIFRPQLEAEVKETVIGNAKASAGGSLRSALARSTGIKRTELEKFEKDDDAINAAIDYKLGLIEGDKAEIKKELDDILSKHQELITAKETEYQSQLNIANQKYIDRDIKETIVNQLKGITLKKGADPLVIAEDIKNFIQSKHHISYDEANKVVELFLKDKPDMPALNKAGTAKMDVLDLAKEYLTPRGLIETDMSGRNPAEEMAGRGEGYNANPGKQKKSLGNNIADKKSAFMETLKTSLEKSEQ